MTPRKDLLDIQSLTNEELDFILSNAVPFKNLFKRSVKKVPTLRGRTVLTLFFENSTRTRSSFEVAASRLSADVINFSVSTSSVAKGETVLDTISTLEAMRTDYVVVRHSTSGIPNLIAKNTTASVINAGDGFHAHPTQALLDVFTIKEVFGGDVRGARIAFIGDIQHSRVARSTNLLCRRLGMQVAMLAPGSLIPREMPPEIAVFKNWDELYKWKPDVIYLLRVQMERQNVPFLPSLGEYHRVYGLTDERLKPVRDAGVWVMHPGPVNRGVELTDNVMTYDRCLIDRQVENGIAIRMSVLYWLKPGSMTEEVKP
jgi:aspartate carbamoyltransferase catalytic subunit